MNALLRSWAWALGGETSGNGVICPGPGHSPRDRSLSVTPSVTAPNGFLVNGLRAMIRLHASTSFRAKLGFAGI